MPGKRTLSRAFIAAIGFVVVALLLVYGLRGQAAAEGRPAPAFELTSFKGSSISLRAMRGHVTVLNFWASWCAPCRAEAPALEVIWQEYRDRGVVFVGVNAQDVRNNALAFIEHSGISYENAPDPYGRVSAAYGVRAFPETFFVASDGTVAKRHIGIITEDQLRQSLDALLVQP